MVETQRQEFHEDVWWLLFNGTILGQLGRSEKAQPLIEAALRFKQDVRESFWDMARIWNMTDPQIEHMAEGPRPPLR